MIPAEFRRFPSEWTVLPFSDVVKDVTSGNTKVPKGNYLENGDYPIVDQGQQPYGGYSNDSNDLFNGSLPAIVFGDHTRAFKYIEESFCLGADGAKVLEPKIENVHKRFLFHYLKQIRIESAGYSRHFKFLKETYIPLPPPDEQKRIAAILDKADAIRRKRQQAIQLADNFLKSVFLDMFGDPVTNPKGWEVATMSELIKIQGGYAFKSSDFAESGTPVVKIGNANKVGFTTRGISFIQPTNPEKLKQYELYPGDLLISLTGTVGKDDYANVTEVSDEYDKYYLNQRVAKISMLKKTVPSNFIKFYLSQPQVKSEITKNNRGVRQANIGNADIYSLRVPLPDEQQLLKFDAIVKSVQSLRIRLNKTPEQVRDLFDALSQKAFAGEL